VRCPHAWAPKIGKVADFWDAPIFRTIGPHPWGNPGLEASKKGHERPASRANARIKQENRLGFSCRRIRESLRETNPDMLGGDGKTVETFIGGLEKNKHRSKRKHAGTGGVGKEAVVGSC
jgi:hypothetical protein